MSVLDAFFLNWRDARETFGEGAPQTGEQFDHSAQFRELETQLESTDPGDTWTGAAADAYGAVNTEHRRVIGELANLDQRSARR
ncbi:EspA/EspE family type VII secretion system effector [Mycolicibacterium thermoresistibile]